MTKNKTYKSDALAAIHETVSDYHTAGVIDKQTMRSFDESCLTPVRAAIENLATKVGDVDEKKDHQ